MSKPSLAQLLHESAKAHQKRASDDDQLVCPSCGYRGPESEFEPDDDSDSDGFRTDDVTGESGQDDPDNEGNRPATYDNKVAALKAKFAGHDLTVVDRILVNRGIDPFED
jgi:hypothetical protein